VLKVLESALRMKTQVDSSSKVRKILFVEKRGGKLHEDMQGDPETGGPVGQVGDWVL
jgi:hypothetical protein